MKKVLTSCWTLLQVETTVASLPTAAVADVLSLLAEYMPECPHLEFILRWLRLLCIKHGPALQVCFLIMLGGDPLFHCSPSCYCL